MLGLNAYLKLRTVLCTVVASLTCAAVPSCANLVLNPGFELGGAVSPGQPIVDWNSNSAPGKSGWGVGNVNPHSGTLAGATVCTGPTCLDPVNGAWISQALTTVASQEYSLTFWFDPRLQGSGLSSGGNYTDLDVYWNGSLVLSLPNEAPGYKQYTISNLIATGPSTVLQFNGQNDPAATWLDDVSVEAATSGAPEPSTLGFGIAGFAALVFMKRRGGVVGVGSRGRQI